MKKTKQTKPVKIKAWVPIEVETTVGELLSAAKRVRYRKGMAGDDGVFMDEIITNLRANGFIALGGIYKLDSEWDEGTLTDKWITENL